MIDKILLAVDGSQNSNRAVELAAELSNKLSADLSIVHVLMHGRPPEEFVHMAEVEHLVGEVHAAISPEIKYVPGSYTDVLKGDAADPKFSRVVTVLGDQIVARAKALCDEKGAKTTQASVRAGDYAEEILNAAEEFDADMVVIGSRGLGMLKSAVLGSVSQKVLHHAKCSVLTVK